MELPNHCTHCRQENMIDVESLESVPLEGLIVARGYTCPGCGKWSLVFLTTRALDEKLTKLKNTPPDHPSFWYRFVKLFKRAKELQTH